MQTCSSQKKGQLELAIHSRYLNSIGMTIDYNEEILDINTSNFTNKPISVRTTHNLLFTNEGNIMLNQLIN